MLIQKTVEQAKKRKLRYFSTTLLCSPYKNHDEIIEISNERALDYDVNFYYQDFRKGYWSGRNYARNHNVYIPRFCGCVESFKERRLE
jgi:predicted adenine nucleotide alpha hydrolase (AANH) superfamily ATPase